MRAGGCRGDEAMGAGAGLLQGETGVAGQMTNRLGAMSRPRWLRGNVDDGVRSHELHCGIGANVLNASPLLRVGEVAAGQQIRWIVVRTNRLCDGTCAFDTSRPEPNTHTTIPVSYTHLTLPTIYSV